MLRLVSWKASHTFVRPVHAWNRRHIRSVRSSRAESTYVIRPHLLTATEPRPMLLPTCRCPDGDRHRTRTRSVAAALPGLFKSIEQAHSVGSGERLQPVRLASLDGITRDCPLGAKQLRFPFHLVVPSVLVQFAHVHEHAHLGNGLELGRAGFPHVSRERSNRQEVLWMSRRDVKRGDT